MKNAAAPPVTEMQPSSIDLLYTGPVITQCKGSITEKKIFSIGQIIDLFEFGDIYRCGRTKCTLQFSLSYHGF